jgi:hypothetical protein
MTICLGTVPASTTIYIPFATYAGSTGASVTMTGLAVTDIEIYKNGSATQRASDNGYALLDTDGIDFDGITGIHGFSIDLSDNTDSGFYSVGAWYWVVVSAVTVDSQTVNFVAAVFRIGPAESVAGYPKADVSHFGGAAGAFASGRPEVNTTHVAGTAQTAGDIIADTNDIQSRLPAALVSGRMDASVGAMAANALTASALAADAVTEIQSGLSTLDAAGVRSAVGLASANLDTQLAAIDDYLDTEVAAIKTETDKIASIKAKTDSLAFTVAGQVDANVQSINDVTITGNGQVGTEFGV